MKNENTDTINRAIHSAMGKCWHEHDLKPRLNGSPYCKYCSRTFAPNPDYTVPGQPLEDAKAWAVKKVGISEFGYLVLKYSGQHTNTNRYYPIGLAATLPAFDMANIIAGLINEGENK